MKKLFESKILDELYETRSEGLARAIRRKYGKSEDIEKGVEAEEELTRMIEEAVKNKRKFKAIFNKLDEFEGYLMGEMGFLEKHYYKLGFVDGVYFKKELQEERNNIIETFSLRGDDDNFFNEYSEILIDYIEEKKLKKLRERKDYNDILMQIEEIKNKYPKVQEFIEDEKISEFTNEEMQAIIDIYNLKNDIVGIEKEEIFKLGLKENNSL